MELAQAEWNVRNTHLIREECKIKLERANNAFVVAQNDFQHARDALVALKEKADAKI